MSMRITLPILAFLIFGCGNATTTSQTNETSQPLTISEDLRKKHPPGDILKLVKREVIDREGTGMVASTYLLPADWTVEDRLYWEYNDPTLPIRFKAKMQSGAGDMFIQSFPDVRSLWSAGPAGVSGYQPPQDIISGIQSLIQQERPGIQYQVVNTKVLSDKSQPAYGGTQRTSSGIVKIQYQENGKQFEEEFYASLDVVHVVTPSMMGNMESYAWAAAGLYACKAVTGKLDDCRKIAQTVASSASWTKPFFNRVMQVTQLLSDQVYAQIFQAGQISKIISQTNDRMIANIDASYRQSQESYDRINNNFSDYIRGVDRYDEGGTEVQLPSGYDNAWVNDRGEYLLSTSAGFNPGVDIGGNWTALERR
jgi:hypothetical protein